MLFVLKWIKCTLLLQITLSSLVNSSLQVHSKINGNVSLKCASVLKEVSQDLSLQWKKGSTLSSSELLIDSILGSIGGPYSGNEKYILNVKDGTLSITNLSLDDDGNYFCELLNSPYSVSSIKLTVTVPLSTSPIIDVCGKPGDCNITTVIDEEVALTCLAVFVKAAVDLVWKNSSMTLDGSQIYMFSNSDGTVNVSSKIQLVVRSESVITCEAVGEGIPENPVDNVATLWIQINPPFADLTQTPLINVCGGKTNCTVFYSFQDTIHLTCLFTIKHDGVELHWINELSIIDGQSYSTQKDHSGETTISTTLMFTFYHPVLLSCRCQHSNRKGDYVSSWVQLERNAEVSSTFTFLDEPYLKYLIAAVGAAVFIIFLIVCLIVVIRIRRNNSTKNTEIKQRRKLSPKGTFSRRGYRLQKCETSSLREQEHLEISIQGQKKKKDWRQQNAFDEG